MLHPPACRRDHRAADDGASPFPTCVFDTGCHLLRGDEMAPHTLGPATRGLGSLFRVQTPRHAPGTHHQPVRDGNISTKCSRYDEIYPTVCFNMVSIRRMGVSTKAKAAHCKEIRHQRADRRRVTTNVARSDLAGEWQAGTAGGSATANARAPMR